MTTTASPTLAIHELCARLTREGRQIFRLGMGQSPFPVPRPVVEALQANAFQNDYLPVKGLMQLREAVAGYHRSRHGISCTSEDVLIGAGSKELLFLVQFVNPADLVIPSPNWVSYAPQARLLGRTVCWLPTRKETGWRLAPEDLDHHCRRAPDRRRILILNYPNNPTGLTYTAAQLKALAAVARRRRLLVVADEIYGELHHAGNHISLAKFYPEGTIVSSGLSKWCGAGGWRLGTFVFPSALRDLLEAMAEVASQTYTTATAPVQYAAVCAYEWGNEIETYLAQVRRILAALGRYTVEKLKAAGIDAHPPEGAFYLLADFSPHQRNLRARGITTAPQLCERLLEDAGVAILPGSAFGRPPDELTARLAYVDFDGARCLSALQDRDPSDDFLREHCAPVTAALDRLAAWL